MTVRRQLDLLASTFVVRPLQAWSENLGKRQVKAPKVYLADSGLLHALLGIEDATDLVARPEVGASWEGFALLEVVRQLGARWNECSFWRTHQGAELDLLVVRGQRRRGFEFKRTSSPAPTRSTHIARTDLKLDRLDIVYPGPDSFPLGERTFALALSRLAEDLVPL
jgi:predicted AAA+ superfamily ATPase